MGEHLALSPWQELGCVLSPLLLPTIVPEGGGAEPEAALGPSCLVTQLGALLRGEGVSVVLSREGKGLLCPRNVGAGTAWVVTSSQDFQCL